MAADRGGDARTDGEWADEPSDEELDDGRGRAAIWEYLSERRRRD